MDAAQTAIAAATGAVIALVSTAVADRVLQARTKQAIEAQLVEAHNAGYAQGWYVGRDTGAQQYAQTYGVPTDTVIQ